MSRLCTICARGGSKGVPNKNLRIVAGRPLLAHSVRQARQARLFDRIVVSSDSDEILRVGLESGADFLIKRPDDLATDSSAKLPVIRHALHRAEKAFNTTFDTVIDLDATSPLRTIDDIQNAVALGEEEAVSNVVTAAPSRRSPYFNLVEVTEDGQVTLAKPLPLAINRRQDVPATFDLNASIYVWKRDVLLNAQSLFVEGTRLYVMPEERSIDIDSALDLELVEILATQRGALS